MQEKIHKFMIFCLQKYLPSFVIAAQNLPKIQKVKRAPLEFGTVDDIKIVKSPFNSPYPLNYETN